MNKIINIRSSADSSIIFSTLIRAASLLSRFILLIFLANKLSPEEVGRFGIFFATVAFSLYILGLDFYSYVGREIVVAKSKDAVRMVRDQLVFIVSSYIFLLPLLSTVFFLDILGFSLLGWFYLIVLSEHFSQELYRVLRSLGRPIWSQIVLFVRTSAWVYVVVLLMWNDVDRQNLETIWLFWSIGSILSILIALWVMRDLEWKKGLAKAINWDWIKKGIQVSGYFIVGTIALRAVFLIDRSFLKLYWGEDIVGVYVFFIGITMAIIAFVDAGVVSYYYPKIIKMYKEHQAKAYKKIVKEMWVRMLVVIVTLGVFLYVIIDELLEYTGHSIYKENKSIFLVLIVVASLQALSQIPRMQLYAMKKDNYIIYSDVVVLLVFLLASVVLIPVYNLLGLSIALMCAFIVYFAMHMILSITSERTFSSKVVS